MQLKLKGLLVMQTVEIIVNILMVIVAVLLVIVVLAQNAKSAGLGSAFGNDTTALGQARNAKAGREAKLQRLTVIFHSRCACSCSARYRLMFMRSGFGRNDPNFDFAAQHLIF